MIKVQVFHEDDEGLEQLLAEMFIVRLDKEEEVSDYSVRFAVERGGQAYGLHQRVLRRFGRKKANALGLVFASLAQLTPDEMELEGEFSSSDVAWGFKGAMREIQARTGIMRRD